MRIIAFFAVMLLVILASSVLAVPRAAQTTAQPTAAPNVLTTGVRELLTYPVRSTAPELTNTIWLNSDKPLRLEDLRGQVILLEFWTFDCINCIRTIPYVEGWYQTYKDQGFLVIGNHFPEFRYEHDVQNVYAALDRLEITYPVSIDNDGAVWRSYNQRYWPTIYLIDKWGDIRYLHFGEGRYTETEAAIQTLLAEEYVAEEKVDTAEVVEAEVYLTPDIVLNVRSGAGLDHEIIGAINPDMALVILEQVDGWYKIHYNDGEGYVSADYVTVASR